MRFDVYDYEFFDDEELDNKRFKACIDGTSCEGIIKFDEDVGTIYFCQDRISGDRYRGGDNPYRYFWSCEDMEYLEEWDVWDLYIGIRNHVIKLYKYLRDN